MRRNQCSTSSCIVYTHPCLRLVSPITRKKSFVYLKRHLFITKIFRFFKLLSSASSRVFQNIFKSYQVMSKTLIFSSRMFNKTKSSGKVVRPKAPPRGAHEFSCNPEGMRKLFDAYKKIRGFRRI